ncbi:MAG: tRNA preQ1(34) S-adenosylmethionine ribosyltransferase-isomerase QueA [Anaerolineales bacterium]
MQTSDFDYNLPQANIAQTPAEPRDSSRLLILNRASGEVEHRVFSDVLHFLRPKDCLILNRTRVIPARIFARKESSGKAELLLLRRRDELTWEALVGGKGLRVGSKLLLESKVSRLWKSEKSGDFALQPISAEIIEILAGAERLVKFSEPIEPHLSQIGVMPLPPYIHETLKDPERYQTVFSRDVGSAAAPTAGLHFTPRLLDEIKTLGVNIGYVTLHVGLDTFAPVTEDDPAAHKIHTEWCELPPETADLINETRKNGGRVIAVGTTSVRTLESAEAQQGKILPYAAATSIFILPGYSFKFVDAMITNFHLPKSTLIMLVSAFAGREKILQTYQTAIREGYRFYSFGDAMLIV